MSQIYLCHEKLGDIKVVIDAIKDLVNEVNFVFQEKGLIITTVDSSHVTLVNGLLSSQFFDTFQVSFKDVSIQQQVTLGVSLLELSKILRCGNTSDQLEILYSEISSKDVLVLKFSGSTNATVHLKLVDIESLSNIQVPSNFQYDYEEFISCGDFNKTCRSLSSFTDDVIITRTSKGLDLSGRGDAVDKAEFNIALSTRYRVPYQHKFSLKYLDLFAKASSLSSVVILKLKANSPLLVHYELERASFIEFYLAPVLEE